MILLQRENTKLNPMSNRVKKKPKKQQQKKKTFVPHNSAILWNALCSIKTVLFRFILICFSKYQKVR